MIRIAICDDNEDFRQYEYGLVNGIMYSINCVCETDFFQSGNELLTKGEQVAGYNIILLDINMPGIDGIKTAEKIREYTEEVFIVFVTSFISYALEGYKVGATRYLLKSSESLKRELKECLETITRKLNYFENINSVLREHLACSKHTFGFIEGELKVPLDKIIYIESNLHRLFFHILDRPEKYSVYDKLDNVEEKLAGYGFCRVHKSYLVNMKYVESITRYSAELYNGIKINVSKARYNNAREQFMRCQ